MIHPSYVDLMNIVNEDVEEGEAPVINSRYSIVMACAKRARQLVDGDDPMVDDAEGKKPLSIAVEELEQKKLKILPQDEETVEQMELKEVRQARALEEDFIEEDLAESERRSREDEDDGSDEPEDDEVQDESEDVVVDREEDDDEDEM